MTGNGELGSQSLAAMLDLLPERVVRYSVSGRRIKYCNQSWAAAHGQSPAELLGRSLDDLLSSAELEGVESQLSRLGPDTSLLNDVTARPAPESPERWIAWADQFLPGPDGGDVLAVGRDVTDQHLATLAMTESEQRFRHLAEHSADVVWRLAHTPNPHFTYLSPSVEKFTGYTPNELHEDFGRFIAILGQEDGACFLSKSQGNKKAAERYDLTFRRLDGAKVIAEMQVTHLPDGSQGVGRDVTQLRELQAELTKLALRDPLTGLANRRLLDELLPAALRRAARSSAEVSVIFLDLDNFKSVNDTYGHKTGDLVLATVADRLRASVRDADTVARVGGDEFVLIHESHDPMAVEYVVERLHSAIGVPIELEDSGIVFCTASIGFARATAGQSAASLIAEAALVCFES
jgi:diguanylate cyclase (GGDEF)-like protein/PAS domain S-box-containing protein